MPKNITFQIGDIVNDTHFGFGIIIGQKPFSDPLKLQYYHVYYFNIKIFLYRTNMSLSLHHAVNDKSHMLVQNIVLTKLASPKAYSRWQIGDIINIDGRRILFLDNGHQMRSNIANDDKVLYHMYDTTTNQLSYNDVSPRRLLNRIPATPGTKREAMRFIIDNIFSQIF